MLLSLKTKPIGASELKSLDAEQISKALAFLKVFSLDASNNPVYNVRNPEFKSLSEADQKTLKLSVLFHDITKREGMVDEKHYIESALYTRNIIEKLNLPEEVKERIYNMINNHHWLGQLENGDIKPEAVAAIFRNPEDFKAAKIFAESDSKGVSNDVYSQNSGALQSEKIKKVEEGLTQIYSKGIPLFQTKIPVDQHQLPVVSHNGETYRVIDLTKSGIDLEAMGFEKDTTPDNLRFTAHFLLGDDKGAPSVIYGLTDEANQGCLSTSLVSKNHKHTLTNRLDGFVIDSTNSNIALAYKDDACSGIEKGFEEFTKFLTSNQDSRTFVPSQIKQALSLNDSEYAQLYRQIAPFKNLSEIQDININGSIIKADDIRSTIKASTDSMFEGNHHNEVVIFNPKVKAVISKRNSIEEIPQHILDFAKEHNLPIVLFGNF